MDGYKLEGSCNWYYVKYYMILIYSYFYKIGNIDVKYKSYIKMCYLIIVKNEISDYKTVKISAQNIYQIFDS